MFSLPGTLPDLDHRLTREAAEHVARNWWMLLLNGAVLVVAGVLIFSISWSVRSLSTFIGALFIFEGITHALTDGVETRVRRANLLTGLLSIAAGVAIIVWPTPGLTAVAVFLGSWLIVVGTLTIAGAFAARRFLPEWWLLLITGLLMIPLGVLALADPGATLAALVTVGGIWAVAIGVSRMVLSFQLKRLPEDLDRAWRTTRAPDRAAQPAAARAGDRFEPAPR